jgi:flavin-dependent dehydrogenase
MRPHDDFHNFRSDIEGNFLQYAGAGAPAMAERVGGGKREERFIGTADTRNFRRKPYGLGWALVGDAGYHRDPVTGLGISDAFSDVERLTDAIDDGFAGRTPLADAMARYQRERDAATEDDYQRTLFLAKFPPRDVFLAKMAEQMQAAAAAQAAQAG